jgi:hypothetical protein
MRKLLALFNRKPDLEIGDNYLHRWYVIPRNKYFNVYLHKIISDDDDRAFHDHPWYSLSFLLKGELVEHSFKGVRFIPRFSPVFRTAKFAHRLQVTNKPVWTLFITGPRFREWGFYCPKTWVHWKSFTSPDGKNIGNGCGEVNDK